MNLLIAGKRSAVRGILPKIEPIMGVAGFRSRPGNDIPAIRQRGDIHIFGVVPVRVRHPRDRYLGPQQRSVAIQSPKFQEPAVVGLRMFRRNRFGPGNDDCTVSQLRCLRVPDRPDSRVADRNRRNRGGHIVGIDNRRGNKPVAPEWVPMRRRVVHAPVENEQFAVLQQHRVRDQGMSRRVTSGFDG